MKYNETILTPASEYRATVATYREELLKHFKTVKITREDIRRPRYELTYRVTVTAYN